MINICLLFIVPWEKNVNFEKIVEKMEKARDNMDRPKLTVELFLILFTLTTISYFVTGRNLFYADALIAQTVTGNPVWYLFSLVLLTISWVPDLYRYASEKTGERNFSLHLGNIVRYSITVWFLWVIVNVAIFVYICCAVVWTLFFLL